MCRCLARKSLPLCVMKLVFTWELAVPRRFRAVTHYWITDEMVDRFVGGMTALMSNPDSYKSDSEVSYYG